MESRLVGEIPEQRTLLRVRKIFDPRFRTQIPEVGSGTPICQFCQMSSACFLIQLWLQINNICLISNYLHKQHLNWRCQILFPTVTWCHKILSRWVSKTYLYHSGYKSMWKIEQKGQCHAIAVAFWAKARWFQIRWYVSAVFHPPLHVWIAVQCYL